MMSHLHSLHAGGLPCPNVRAASFLSLARRAPSFCSRASFCIPLHRPRAWSRSTGRRDAMRMRVKPQPLPPALNARPMMVRIRRCGLRPRTALPFKGAALSLSSGECTVNRVRMRLFRRHAAVDEVTKGTSTPHAHSELLVLVGDLVCVCAALKKSVRDARREAISMAWS